MIEQVRDYFNAEKAESLIFIAIGFFAILLSLYLMVKQRGSFSYGVSTALIAIALIQISVGAGIYYRSNSDISRVETALKGKAIEAKKTEITRMEVVMKNFDIYRYVEITFILGAILLMYLTASQSFWAGLGVGLLAQSTIMLISDFFAERRGATYIDWLISLVTT
jgi:hypothetical protein